MTDPTTMTDRELLVSLRTLMGGLEQAVAWHTGQMQTLLAEMARRDAAANPPAATTLSVPGIESAEHVSDIGSP